MLPLRLLRNVSALMSGGMTLDTAYCQRLDKPGWRFDCPAALADPRRSNPCRRCVPRFRTVMQVDGDIYLKIRRGPRPADPNRIEAWENRVLCGLFEHQRRAAGTIGRFGDDLDLVSRTTMWGGQIAGAGASYGAGDFVWSVLPGWSGGALTFAGLMLVSWSLRRVPRDLTLRLLYWLALRRARALLSRLDAERPRLFESVGAR